jgi:glutathione S-transferase
MAIKLHRCNWMWFKLGAHPCWRVQQALDEKGVEYELVKHPAFPPSARNDLEQLSGQRKLPVLEFEDGRVLREESKDMAARVREDRLEQPAAPA